LKAKKSYGQHFLNSEQIAQRIARSLKWTNAYRQVLEVGPGRGMLTRFLLEREDLEIFAVEADPEMAWYLRKHFPQLKGHLIEGDFLKLPLDEVFEGQPFGLIGNFPYNISSQILFRMLEYRGQIPEMVGMFQKEMAERVVSEPGGKTYGVISVLVQAYYEGEYLFEVDKRNFFPAPKVQSAVIRLTRREQQQLDCDESLFRQVVKIAFSQRRKMLRNTMKTFIKGDSLLKGPFFTQRPEKLSVEDFVQLTKQIEQRVDL
jgi:16S rRNA (adenine1518-N6/adenine1519-N6)-dimethyltransferase